MVNKASLWLARHKKLIALGVILLIALFWLWRGQLYQAAEQAPKETTLSEVQEQHDSQRKDEPYYVEVTPAQAQRYQPTVQVQGQLLPARHLALRAQVNGTLTHRPTLGQTVAAQEPLITLSDEGRTARLEQAKAELALRQAEANAGVRLRRERHISETDYLGLVAAAANAKAAVADAQLALEHTQLTAPFAGQVDQLPVEEGDFVQAGETLLTLVDVSHLKLSALIGQQQVSSLTPGLPVTAVLLDGRKLEGQLNFVAQEADRQTRSFALEARLDNPQQWRVAGGSASLQIHLPEQQAYRLSPALLALTKEGRLGVYVVDEAQRMQLQPVKLLNITPDEAWVDGLPEQVQLVTRGAGFVAQGEKVNVKVMEPAS